MLDGAAGFVNLFDWAGPEIAVGGGFLAGFAFLYSHMKSGDLEAYRSAVTDPALVANMQCAIYTATAGSGYVTDGNYAAVRAAIAGSTYPSPVVITGITQLIDSLGSAGLQALQVPGGLTEGADCAGCGDWCRTWDFKVGHDGWFLISGFWTAGVGFTSFHNASADLDQLIISTQTGFGSLTSIGVVGSAGGGSSTPAAWDFGRGLFTHDTHALLAALPNTSGGIAATVDVATGDLDSYNVCWCAHPAAGGTVLSAVTLRGIGTPPGFGTPC